MKKKIFKVCLWDKTTEFHKIRSNKVKLTSSKQVEEIWDGFNMVMQHLKVLNLCTTLQIEINHLILSSRNISNQSNSLNKLNCFNAFCLKHISICFYHSIKIKWLYKSASTCPSYFNYLFYFLYASTSLPWLL